MWEKFILTILENRGKVLGVLLGLLLGLSLIFLGLIKTLFIIFCIAIGYFIGKNYDEAKGLKKMFDKILPPRAK